jgi:hypothetical protein
VCRKEGLCKGTGRHTPRPTEKRALFPEKRGKKCGKGSKGRGRERERRKRERRKEADPPI